MKILALHLRSFIDYAQVRGIGSDVLLKCMQSPEVNFSDPHATVDAEDLYRVLAAIQKLLQDDQLGWRIGKFLNLNALGLIYQISLQTTTVAEAVHYLENFINTTLPLIQVETKLCDRVNSITLSIPTGELNLNRIILECVLVIMSREIEMMCTDQVIIKIKSPFYSPSDPAIFEYGESYSLEFSNVNLKASLKRLDNAQLNYLIPAYLMFIQALKKEQSFQNNVKIAVLNMAQPALPGLEEIAESFHLSPRTFQRTLAREKHTFRSIVDDLKKEISVLLLRHNGYSITDVGYLMGYAEPAAFVHSFKKWYGYPPSAVRERG